MMDLNAPLSLYALPILYVTIFYPQVLVISLFMKTTKTSWNVVNPRLFLEACEKKGVNEEAVAKMTRMNNAQLNGLEGFGLWAAAIISANLFGVDHRTTNIFAAALVLSRLVFNTLYTYGASPVVGSMRTGLWTITTLSCLSMLVTAATHASSSATA